MFLTYDEDGGFYDHVPPQAAVPPDAIAPMLQMGDAPGACDRYGSRVPMAVISPYSKAHHVSHTTYDHTSILRFIEYRFGLPTLTARDANAHPISTCSTSRTRRSRRLRRSRTRWSTRLQLAACPSS